MIKLKCSTTWTAWYCWIQKSKNTSEMLSVAIDLVCLITQGFLPPLIQALFWNRCITFYLSLLQWNTKLSFDFDFQKFSHCLIFCTLWRGECDTTHTHATMKTILVPSVSALTPSACRIINQPWEITNPNPESVPCHRHVGSGIYKTVCMYILKPYFTFAHTAFLNSLLENCCVNPHVYFQWIKKKKHSHKLWHEFHYLIRDYLISK